MPTWDLLEEDWAALGDWTETGTGTSEIDPAGQLHCLPAANTYVGRRKDTGTLPEAGYTAEFRLKFDSFGTGDGFVWHDFYDGLHRVSILIYANRIYNQDSGTTIYVANSTGVFDTWRLVIDSDGHSLKVYKNNAYLGDLGAGLDYATADGTVYANMATNLSGESGAESREDYLYIATGLHPPAIVGHSFGYIIG